jgi:hypothetical protein
VIAKRIWELKDRMNSDIRRYGTIGHAPGTWKAVLSMIPMPRDGEGIIINAGCGNHFPVVPRYSMLHCDIRENHKKVDNYIRGDLNAGLPYDDRSADGIIAMEIIEHLENPHFFLRECSRVANDWIMLTYPNNESNESRSLFKKDGCFRWFSEEHARKNGHITPIFSWQVRHIIKKLGLTLSGMRYNDPITKEIAVLKLTRTK